MTKNIIGQKGERWIIEQVIKNKFFNNLELDDCACIEIGSEVLLISVDQMFSKPFLLELGGSYRDLGHLFVTQNVSDIAAMGGIPLFFFSSISFPREFEINNLELFLKGMKEAIEYYKIVLLGGDTKENNKPYFTGTIIGKKHEQVLKRTGCNIGDILCISSPLGRVFSNYVNVMNGFEKKIERPIAEVKLGNYLSSSGLCTSCIDLSDGLLASADIISKANNLSVRINNLEVVFPIKFENNMNWINFALNIGGDYGLLFTLKNNKDSKEFISQNNLTQIGYISERQDESVILEEMEKLNLEIEYWEHFKHLDSFKKQLNEYIL